MNSPLDAAAPALSRGQLPIWVGQRLQPESPLYNMALAFRWEGSIDRSLFDRAWSWVADSVPLLRSVYTEVEGEARRVDLPQGVSRAQWMDLSGERDPEAAFRNWAQRHAERPMRLDDVLVESVLCKLGDADFVWWLNQHHLITDASSALLVFRAVSQVYAVMEAGKPPGAADLGLELAAENVPPRLEPGKSTAAEHWKSRAERTRPVAFYGERETPTGTPSRRHPVELGVEASEAFRAACGEEGFRGIFPEVSRFAGWATVLLAWLHRISGDHALSFHALAANRQSAEARRTVGVFIEMLPFVVDFETGDTFRSLGARCLAETRDYLANAGRQTASAPRGAGSNVVLNYFSGSVEAFAGRPCAVEWVHSGHADKAHAVRLQVQDFGGTGAYSVGLDLNCEVFPPEQARRAVHHFQAVLQAFLRSRDAVIAEIDLLTSWERAQLAHFNAPAAAPRPDRTVWDLFREQVARTPLETAVSEPGRARSFAELDQRVQALAGHLFHAGVVAGDRVAIFQRRSIDAVASILAVLSAGCAYVPIDPGNPASRVAGLLASCRATAVLTESSLADRIAASNVCRLKVDTLGPCATIAPPVPPRLKDLAYIIHTSGSTGEPKGVRVSHEGLADYLTWAAREYVRGDGLHYALFTSLGFDLTVTSLFLPLITGGHLHIYRDADGPVDGAFIAMMEDNVADLIKLTPSHLGLMRQYDLTRSRVRRMILGGEDLKVELADAVCRLFGREVELYNEYGPTEAVVGCMIHRFDSRADACLSSVPIGRPADHVELFVLNESQHPVPPGVPGELCIARCGLAEGYHDKPEATSERFLPHRGRAGDRIYRTGDRVRFLDPARLDYLGRIDRQVKISGHRIELREVEAAVNALDGVEDCIVLAVADGLSPRAHEAEIRPGCVRCGMPADDPGTVIDEDGVCRLCRTYEAIQDRASEYFREPDEFMQRILAKRGQSGSDYDCMALLSGGKDSTYALGQMVEKGLRVYAFTLDNGYLSKEALSNIRRVVETLGVPHEFGTTPAMKAIFRDSLKTFSNVCQGCFKAIYTLSMNRARALGIPFLVTGLSRGQFFETRLTPEMFRGGRFSADAVDRATLEARRVYHRIDDAVRRNLDVSAFENGRILDEIEIIDFYRYHDVSLSQMMAYITTRVPWIRPSDTGRSTNCLINDVGIYIHKRERGFHNYALPYSWDVRMGHKTREQAVMELNDRIDVRRVREILREIDYDEDRVAKTRQDARLTAFYLGSDEVNEARLAAACARHLPRAMVPTRWVRIKAVPLNRNGKVDAEALIRMGQGDVGQRRPARPPEGPVQERVASVWQSVLKVGVVGADESFFRLGGTSLAAMEATIQLCREFDLAIELQTIFQHDTVERLAGVIEALLWEQIEALSEDEAAALLSEEAEDA